MVAVNEHSRADRLHVDGFGLAIGAVSVGLPRSFTAEMVLDRYVELIRLVRDDGTRSHGVPADDIDTLAVVTRLDAGTVRNRLERLLV